MFIGHGVGVHAVIELDNKLLVLKRSSYKKMFPGHWDFPGGTLELGEQPQAGVVREIKEETNLKVKVKNVITTFSIKYGEIWGTIILFKVELISASLVKLNEEHTEFIWASKSEILKLTPQREMIKKAIPALQG